MGVKLCGIKKKIKAGNDLRGELDELICGVWVVTLAWRNVYIQLGVMQSLDICDLHSLRLKIFDNAEDLHKEAKLLFAHEMYARAYLLAYYCFEELGKIPIIVGAIGKLHAGEKVEWGKVKRRFYSHTSKIDSQNTHYYTFGLELDLLRSTDLAWLESARNTVTRSFDMKNLATYVDVKDGSVLIPREKIDRQDAEALLDLAFGCLKAHWHSECLTNPVLLELKNFRPQNDA